MSRLVVMASLCACSAPPVTVVMDVGDEPPAYGDAPFPTDAVREGDRLGTIAGLDRVIGDRVDHVAMHVAALDGFGLRPTIEMFVDGAIDPDTIGGVVIDVDPASPERGREIAIDWRYDDARGVIAGATAIGERLREGTRYAAAITTAVRDAAGEPIARSTALGRLATGEAPARWESTAAAYAELDAMPALAGTIAGLAVFTTQHATAPLIAAATVQAEAEPPALVFDDPEIVFAGAELDGLLGHVELATDGPRAGLERWGHDNRGGVAHAHAGVIGTGRMTAVRFRGDDTTTDDPADETFDIDAEGTPRVVAIEPIPVTFVIPAAPPPPAGYPVAIVGHGLGGSRDHLYAFIEPLTERGYALVAIDMAGHGSRLDPDDVRNNLAGRIDDFTGDPALRDGFGDFTGIATQFDFFEGFVNPAAVRDSIRQSALDLSRLVALLRDPDLDLSALDGPGGVPRLDTTKLAYLGESFGTVVGTLFAAIEPDVDLFVLDVPGGGILDLILPSSAAIGSLAQPILEGIYASEGELDRFHPFIALSQAVLDGADPLTYAPHVLADRFAIGAREVGPRHVVCIEVVGDEVLPNIGTDALSIGLGLDVLTPNLVVPPGLVEVASPASANRDGQTAVLVQYAPAAHGTNWTSERGELHYMPGFPADGDNRFPELPSPITIANPIYATFEQVLEILDTHRSASAPSVRSTMTPVRDFDGDGRTDDVDPDPLDPAR
jgi:hypothetical protein